MSAYAVSCRAEVAADLACDCPAPQRPYRDTKPGTGEKRATANLGDVNSATVICVGRACLAGNVLYRAAIL